MAYRDLAIAHLRLSLRGLTAVLRTAVQEQIARAARLARPDLTPYCITQEEALCLLDDAGALLDDEADVTVLPEDDAAGAGLRAQALRMGTMLPLEVLAGRFRLTAFDRFGVLACAAAELDRGYERLYAFVLDDAGRRAPCVELLTILGARSLDERVARRHALSRFGTLRSAGILVAHGEPTSELRQELRLADGLFDHLTGDGSDIALICADPPAAAVAAQDPRLLSLAHALAVGDISTVGLWGARQSDTHSAVSALAAPSGLVLRAWTPRLGEPVAAVTAGLRAAMQEVTISPRLLWVMTDAFADPSARDLAAAVASQLAGCSVRTVLTGAQPWRPATLLAATDYAELEVEPPDLVARLAMWRQEMPELDVADAQELAARLRFGRDDVRAAVRTARSAARLATDDTAAPAHLPAATTALSGGRCSQFATVIRARRGPEDLILPEPLHAQVLEIAQSFRAWPGVAEGWGFGRLVAGEGGIKALLTGEPGTGKTLAAEVIAGTLGMPLLRVELSRVVSKWVGETEKNLDAAFAEAEASQAVLLFDEADLLFGRRGNVETGVDRYANFEVSHLLQRLDEFGGLVILASNLRDNIDPAFTRRFHIIVHFPRPLLSERLRLWRLAFPPQAPVDPSIDFDALANLDLTGAGIVGAARAAALLAAQENASEIGKPHIVRAVARQFRREARLLTPKDLGPYASLLQDAR